MHVAIIVLLDVHSFVCIASRLCLGLVSASHGPKLVIAISKALLALFAVHPATALSDAAAASPHVFNQVVMNAGVPPSASLDSLNRLSAHSRFCEWSHALIQHILSLVPGARDNVANMVAEW